MAGCSDSPESLTIEQTSLAINQQNLIIEQTRASLNLTQAALPTAPPPPTATITDTPVAVNIGQPAGNTRVNLLQNAAFDEHWSTGWQRFGNNAKIENKEGDNTNWIRIEETTHDQQISGIYQEVAVNGLRGLHLEAEMMLQVSRNNCWGVCPTDPPSTGMLFLLLKDATGEIIGEIWWYGTRNGPNPASERIGYPYRIYAARVQEWTAEDKLAIVEENLYTLALDYMPSLNPDAVASIGVYFGAASQRTTKYFYPGDAWLNDIWLYQA